jgi:hypothetical protein
MLLPGFYIKEGPRILNKCNAFTIFVSYRVFSFRKSRPPVLRLFVRKSFT